MSALETGSAVFACVFGGALLGMILRRVLPDHHLSPESKDIVKLGTGLLATMAALVLSLLIASAKSSYDTQSSELTQLAAGIVVVDRALAHYGPETRDAREALREAIRRMIANIWPAPGAPRPVELNPRATAAEGLYEMIHSLSPKTEEQRLLRSEALRVAIELSRTRWLLFEQLGSSIPRPFLVILVFWLAVIFVSFGLFAPGNATVVSTLLICAISVAGAIFLILELDEPFQGCIRISSDQMQRSLANLGH